MPSVSPRAALACVAGGTVGQALGSVVLGHGVEPRAAVANTLIAFVVAASVSLVALRPQGLRRLVMRLRRSSATRGWSIVLLLATGCVFGGFYLALTTIDAVVVSSLEAGIGPFLALFLFPSRASRLRRAVAPGVALLLSGSVVVLVLSRESTLSAWTAVIGIGLTILVGVAGVVIVLASQRLRSLGLTATDINAVRFVGSSVLFGIAAVPTLQAGGTPVGIRPVVAILLVALPFLVLQVGIVHGDPLRNELVMSSLPALVYLGSSFRATTWSVGVGGLMLAVLLVARAGALREVAAHGAAPRTPPPPHPPPRPRKSIPMSHPHLRVLLIDPESSGADLLAALNQRGAECTTYWQDEVFVRTTHEQTTLPEARLVALSRSAPFDAVVAASESAVSAAEVLADVLDLPTNDPSLTFARRDKAGMVACVTRAGLRAPISYRVTDPDGAAQLRQRLQLPVMVKPAASAGSDSCLVARTWQEVADHVEHVMAGVSILGVGHEAVVVQEYVDGPQYFVNTVSVAGRHLVTDVYSCTFRDGSGAPHLVSGRSFATTDERVAGVVRYVLRCLDALGVRNGAGHTEVRVRGEEPVLIEFNGRLMGPVQPVRYFEDARGYSQASVYATALSLGFDAAAELVRQGVGPMTLAYHLLSATRGGEFVGYDRGVLTSLSSFRGLYDEAAAGTAITLTNRVTTADLGIVFLAHSDESVVENDLRALAASDATGTVVQMR